jgi:hypothetical protein
VKKEQAQIITVFTAPVPMTPKKVESVDGMSSRPWGQIVGIRPGYSVFPSPETADPSMYLITFGSGPLR